MPLWGLLRVYNGAGTAYVDPADVLSMQRFYQYLSRREQIETELTMVKKNTRCSARLEAAIQHLDEERSFLRNGASVQIAPSTSIIAFKHLDASLYWSGHSKGLAWIHCSPMEGRARLVVNVSAAPLARAQFAQPQVRAFRQLGVDGF
jgi:hypothetical protein